MSRTRPTRLVSGAYEVRWREGRRSRSVLPAPRNPLRPTVSEVTEAVRSAYPRRDDVGVEVPDGAWP